MLKVQMLKYRCLNYDSLIDSLGNNVQRGRFLGLGFDALVASIKVLLSGF